MISSTRRPLPLRRRSGRFRRSGTIRSRRSSFGEGARRTSSTSRRPVRRSPTAVATTSSSSSRSCNRATSRSGSSAARRGRSARRPTAPDGDGNLFGVFTLDAQAGPVLVLGIESSCDETGAAVVDERRARARGRRAEPGALHATYGGVVPELASRDHLPNVGPVVREALARAGRTLADDRRHRRDESPGPRRRAARRRAGGEGTRVGARASRSSASITSWATCSRSSCGAAKDDPPRPALSLRGAARVGRAHGDLPRRRPARRRPSRSSARRATTPPARPSTRSRSCSGSVTRAGRSWTSWPRRGDASRVTLSRSDGARQVARVELLGHQDAGGAARVAGGSDAHDDQRVADVCAAFQAAVTSRPRAKD